MATKEQFAEQIARVPGVKNYLLARGDGRVLVHNLSGAERLASMMVIGGLCSERIRALSGLNCLRYLVLGRTGQENFLVFPLEKYLLGVVQHPEVPPGEVAQGVSAFIEQLLRSRNSNGGAPGSRKEEGL